MTGPGTDNLANRPLDELVQTVSEQAMVLARQEVEIARRELEDKARQAATGAAMVGGGVLLTTLAAGTGTAGLVLLFAGQRGPSAAAFGVTTLYAAGGATLTQAGIDRMRSAGPPVPEEAVGNMKENLGAIKGRSGSPRAGSSSAKRSGAKRRPNASGSAPPRRRRAGNH